VVDIRGKACLNDFEMFLEGMTGEKVDALVSCDKMFGVCIWRQKRRFARDQMQVQRILERGFGLSGCGCGLLRHQGNLESKEIKGRREHDSR
jgi:hypothetical protein